MFILININDCSMTTNILFFEDSLIKKTHNTSIYREIDTVDTEILSIQRERKRERYNISVQYRKGSCRERKIEKETKRKGDHKLIWLQRETSQLGGPLGIWDDAGPLVVHNTRITRIILISQAQPHLALLEPFKPMDLLG